ncbi:MAG TPA: PEP/pyruvate-binding domain-containing protein [Gaiellaceae bacterium]|jgi:pyruvate,water dikinase|nr:PEP/pyruvate-binding domain-containing protein [Gaiellaceae bacterium]
MDGVVPLEQAHDVSLFGSKAVGLGEAARSGLPIPPGVALSGDVVEAVASTDNKAIQDVETLVRPLGSPLAVRSSAVDEDGAEASFAGQHMTLLNVPGVDAVADAVREIWWSANSDSAMSYRKHVKLVRQPSVGVVVQSLLDPECAGVMFTRNPMSGADERVIEAAWGLGEAVVAGLVIPDHFRIDRSGEVLERTAGLKRIAVRKLPEGGTFEEQLDLELAEGLCVSDAQLEELHRLALSCEEAYGPDRDIEWAIAEGRLFLLQCRAITRVGSSGVRSAPLFSELDRKETAAVEGLIEALGKKRTFAKGETVIREGSSGATCYLIESGEAAVSIGGELRATLGPGALFGEVALIDEGERIATVTAVDDLVCLGLTRWDIQPLVEANGVIGWKLLQGLTKYLRDAEQVIRDLRADGAAA